MQVTTINSFIVAPERTVTERNGAPRLQRCRSHSAGGIGCWGGKKRECALAYTSERLCMDWQFDESTGGNSLDIMHRGEGKFGTC